MTKNRPDRESNEWLPENAQEELTVTKLVLDDFPYPHTDVWASTYNIDTEKDKLVFGIPRHHEQGMAFYYVDNEGAERWDERPIYDGENPECHFHDKKTVVTKHFDFSGTDRLQFKCPECYLTRYKNDMGLKLRGGQK